MKEFGLIPHRSSRWPLVVVLPAFCPQTPPIVPVLPTQPTGKYCAVYNLRFDLFHGMEEVVGSIPTRSTKSLQAFSRSSTEARFSSNPGSDQKCSVFHSQ